MCFNSKHAQQIYGKEKKKAALKKNPWIYIGNSTLEKWHMMAFILGNVEVVLAHLYLAFFFFNIIFSSQKLVKLFKVF